MSSGKIASQAGHAYLDSYLKNPDEEYLNNPTKICLRANKLELERVCMVCERNHISYTKVVDPDFTIVDSQVIRNDGSQPPAFTAVGIGPIEKQSAKKAVNKLKLF